MLKRKISAQLYKWVENKNKKCLVVQGARQTGKTFAIERFAEDRYEECREYNCSIRSDVGLYYKLN